MTETYAPSFDGAIEEVALAYEQVPFFRTLMERAGLRPGELSSPADFRRIPATSKVDYRRNFPAGVLVRGASLNDPFVFRSQSSGTTGERLVTIAHNYLLADRMTTTSGVNPALCAVFASPTNQRICRYAAPNCSDVECATPFTTPESRTLPDGTRVLPVAHDLLSTPDNMIDQALTEIVDYQPRWLYTDPMHLAFLARNLVARNIPAPSVGGVVLTYNLVTQSARRQVAAVFGDSVIAEVVSMSELGWMGMECPHGFVHMNTDSFYLEFLVDDRPAEPGELAELYVTSIGDDISPHLRYRTGDYYTMLDGPCSCGHPSPRVDFHGRASHVVRADGKPVLTPKMLDRLVGTAPWLTVYKLRQPEPDRVRLRYIPACDNDGDPRPAEELAARLSAALGPRIAVAVEPVEYIECERSGKFLACVSEVGP
jgi:phenylacetate-CoA ligase